MRRFSPWFAFLFTCVSIILSTAASALITVGALDTTDARYAYDVTVVGNLAYAVGADGLGVVDVSDPTMPVVVGSVDTPGIAFDVDVVGQLAYLADSIGGLRVLDVSDPTAPLEIGALDALTDARGIDVVDDLACVVNAEGGLHLIDISNPTAPVELGAIDTPSSAWDIAVVGNVAYVADYESGLRVIDISDPADPLELGFIDTPGRASVVEVVGDLAYIADGGQPADPPLYFGGLRIIDVSSPLFPVEVGAFETSDFTRGAAIEDDLAYVSGAFGLLVVDVSDPSSPVPLNALDTPGGGLNVDVVGNFAYVADGARGGLRIIQISSPGFPLELSQFVTPGNAYDVEVADGVAYVADSYAGLQVIHVTDPTSPIKIGGLDAPNSGSWWWVEVAGELAYATGSGIGESGLHVIDISDPTSPAAIGFVNTHDGDIELAGDFAYMAAGPGGGLRVFDVSDPTTPMEVGVVETQATAWDVEVVGNFAYVAEGLLLAGPEPRTGLEIMDLSDPAFPVVIGAVEIEADMLSVAVSGDYAYLTSSDFGLHVIDVSDPIAPVEIAAFETQLPAWDLDVDGNFAYLALSLLGTGVGNGVLVIDVSDPATPRDVGFFPTRYSSWPRDIEVVDDFVYLAGRGSGLHIFEFGPEYVQKITVDLDIKPGSEPNTINPSVEGVIPAAILGSDSFNVADVDAETLAFGPDGAAPAHCHGPHVEDVNGDGFLDLMAHFRTEETGIVYGTLVACLEGATLDGKPFNGCDVVRTVPDMDGDKLLDTEEARFGTNALSRDTDRDGFTDGEEALVMRTDPLDAHDPAPTEKSKRGGRRRR